MSPLQAYLLERQRTRARLWLGFAAANGACIAGMLMLLYV